MKFFLSKLFLKMPSKMRKKIFLKWFKVVIVVIGLSLFLFAIFFKDEILYKFRKQRNIASWMQEINKNLQEQKNYNELKDTFDFLMNSQNIFCGFINYKKLNILHFFVLKPDSLVDIEEIHKKLEDIQQKDTTTREEYHMWLDKTLKTTEHYSLYVTNAIFFDSELHESSSNCEKIHTDYLGKFNDKDSTPPSAKKTMICVLKEMIFYKKNSFAIFVISPENLQIYKFVLADNQMQLKTSPQMTKLNIENKKNEGDLEFKKELLLILEKGLPVMTHERSSRIDKFGTFYIEIV
ncbi:hypothetical protein EDEG_03697 [Edhazardia aedis USNM 41457]|uniref:Uncharacterized protein n=1 Tax=Edhazardia aedis (strain USNM 41457) TaxID=1003232 RepID=J9DKA5_EDHAE|nr:hypothetical protein EDEG_03697 [Edhazardia aedis USNM 41457]|eukprot:EJW01807.2 hypothetical protein EDEG_03697 [Edhazardia aedis USNM 41457]